MPARPAGESATVRRGSNPTAQSSEPRSAADRKVGAFDDPRERFEPREELGRGGMGVVIEAYDRALKRPVAIKQMQSASDVDLARFEREAEITALLEHPGIVPIHDAGRSADGLPYYVMRRIDGEPLDQEVRDKPFAERIARVPNLLAACDAVGFAHARGVIHRDLKPTNILIGPFGETLVIDWGLARMLGDATEVAAARNSDAQLTRVGSVAGTPGFMAPEQARGETLDSRADVYALGATLFYVLAGAVAFSASGGTEMIERAASGGAPEWHRLPAETPRELRAIIEKAMAHERDARYRDATELAGDLRRYIAGQFVGAYRYGLREQIAVLVRRHRAAVAVGAIAFAVILFGSVFSIRRILDERDEARQARVIAEANQREAAAKRDQLVVQHALHLSELDPAAAITTLRRLPADSVEWPRASAVATAASVHGIPFGFSVPELAGGGSLELSPDSTAAAMTRPWRGVMYVIELDTRQRQRFTVDKAMAHVLWVDARTLVGFGARDIWVVDRTRGVVRHIELPGVRSTMVTDGQGRIYVSIAGHAHAVDIKTGTVGPALLDAVTSMYSVGDGRLVIDRGTRLDLWSPDGTIRTLRAGSVLRTLVGDRRIAANIDGEVCVWNIAAAEPSSEACYPVGKADGPVGFLGNFVFLDGPGRMTARNSQREVKMAPASGYVAPRATGLAYATLENKIILIDRKGSFSFSSGRDKLTRVVQTLDERFVVGLTSTGDVLAWDLPEFRPIRYAQESRRRVFAVTLKSIWMIDTQGGIFRLDRASGADVQVATDQAMQASVDGSENWLVVGHPVPTPQSTDSIVMTNTLYNLRTGVRFQGEPGDAFAFFDDTALVIDHRGEVLTLAADGSRRRVTAIDGVLETMSVNTPWLLFATSRSLCRYHLTTNNLVCIARPAGAGGLAIESNGRAWYLVDGALWQWAEAGPPRPSWSSLKLTHFAWAGDNLLAAGAGVIVKLYDPIALPLSIPPMREFIPGGEATLYAITPDETVAAIDIATGIVVNLPIPGGLFSASAGGRDGAIAISRVNALTHENELVVYQAGRQRDRASMRAWLDTVTNAVPIGDTDVVAWP